MSSRVIDATLRLKDEFTNKFNKSIKAMTNGTKAAQRVGKSITRTGRDMKRVGSDMTKAFTVPIAGAGVAALKFANDFEGGIAKVSTIADTSAMSLDKIKDNTLKLSNSMGIAAKEISEAQYQAISAGAATEKSLELVSVAAKAAKGGFTDVGTAINGLTTIYNSYQGAIDYDKISDQMLAAQNYGKTSFGELASSMGKVTPIAKSLNVSTEELLGSIAVLTKNGIATAESVTGLKAAYSNVLKPSKQATDEAKRLGLEFNAAHLQSVGWAKFINEIKEKTDDNADSMAKLFGSVEALNSVTVLAGAGNKQFAAALQEVNNAAGLTDSAYQKMLTPAERFHKTLNKLKNSGIKVGERLLPFFEKFTERADVMADKFTNMSDKQIDGLIKIGAALAFAGPFLKTFGGGMEVAGKGITKFNEKLLGIKNAGGFAKAALTAIASPAGIVVAVLAAIAAVVAICIHRFDWLKSGLNQMSPQLDSLKAGFTRLKNSMAPVGGVVLKIGKIFGAIFEGVIVSAIAAALGAIIGFLTGIIHVANGITQALGGIIKFIKGVFTGNWKLAWEGVQDIFNGIFNAMLGLAKGVINGISGAINGVIGVLNKIKVPDWVPGIGGKGVNIPKIPALASGTTNWQGGLAQISEKGGEIVDLPNGTRVYPHDKSVQMARAEGNITVAKLADTIVVREDADIDKIATAIAHKIQLASRNRGGVTVGGMA